MEFFCSRPMRLCAKRACDDDDDDDDDDNDDDRSQTLMPPADRCSTDFTIGCSRHFSFVFLVVSRRQ